MPGIAVGVGDAAGEMHRNLPSESLSSSGERQTINVNKYVR